MLTGIWGDSMTGVLIFTWMEENWSLAETVIDKKQ